MAASSSGHLGQMEGVSDYEDEELNVFGMALERCSRSGMAMTGLDDRCGHNPQFDDRSHPICIDLPSFPTLLREKDPEENARQEYDHNNNNYHTGHVPTTTTTNKKAEDGQEQGQHRQRRTSLWSYLFGDKSEAKNANSNMKEVNFFTATGEQNWVEDHIPCADNPKKRCPIQHWCVNEKSFAEFLDEAGGCHKIGNLICEAINRNVLESYPAGKGGDKGAAALRCIMDRCWIPAQ